MIVVAVLVLLAIVALQVRSGRRAGVGATPVIIVRPPRRWLRDLVAKAVSGLLTLTILGGLFLAALHVGHSAPTDTDPAQVSPVATPSGTSGTGKATPTHGHPSPSHSATPRSGATS